MSIHHEGCHEKALEILVPSHGPLMGLTGILFRKQLLKDAINRGVL